MTTSTAPGGVGTLPRIDEAPPSGGRIFSPARERRLAYRAALRAGVPPPVSAERRSFSDRAVIDLDEGMSLDIALRSLKKQCARADIMRELKAPRALPQAERSPPGEVGPAPGSRAAKRTPHAERRITR